MPFSVFIVATVNAIFIIGYGTVIQRSSWTPLGSQVPYASILLSLRMHLTDSSIQTGSECPYDWSDSGWPKQKKASIRSNNCHCWSSSSHYFSQQQIEFIADSDCCSSGIWKAECSDQLMHYTLQ